MKLIDSHCHLDAFKNHDKIVSAALKSGVKAIITSGCSGNNHKTLELARKYPNYIFPVIGVAPQEAVSMPPDLLFLKENRKTIIGIGEVGLDFHWAKNPDQVSKQRNCFELLLHYAVSEKLPLVVHSREAEEEVIDMLLKNNAEKVLLHCFSGNLLLAEKAVEHGFFISIPPIPSRRREKIIKHIPLQNLMLETDAPYLGKEPSDVIHSAELVASIKCVEMDEVCEVTTRNCINLFGLSGLNGGD